MEDKEHPGPVKKFVEIELEALLNESFCQIQYEPADLGGMPQKAFTYLSKCFGMIKKVEYYIAYELKPLDVFSRTNSSFNNKKRNVFSDW